MVQTDCEIQANIPPGDTSNRTEYPLPLQHSVSFQMEDGLPVKARWGDLSLGIKVREIVVPYKNLFRRPRGGVRIGEIDHKSMWQKFLVAVEEGFVATTVKQAPEGDLKIKGGADVDKVIVARSIVKDFVRKIRSLNPPVKIRELAVISDLFHPVRFVRYVIGEDDNSQGTWETEGLVIQSMLEMYDQLGLLPKVMLPIIDFRESKYALPWLLGGLIDNTGSMGLFYPEGPFVTFRPKYEHVLGNNINTPFSSRSINMPPLKETISHEYGHSVDPYFGRATPIQREAFAIAFEHSLDLNSIVENIHRMKEGRGISLEQLRDLMSSKSTGRNYLELLLAASLYAYVAQVLGLPQVLNFHGLISGALGIHPEWGTPLGKGGRTIGKYALMITGVDGSCKGNLARTIQTLSVNSMISTVDRLLEPLVHKLNSRLG